MTIVFGMPGGVLYTIGLPPWYLAVLFGIAFVAVMLSIFPHELAHKFVAQRYGYWSEFRRYDMGLILGLVLSLSGFPVIAAPGAVMIAGPVTTETNGKISAVGPGTNALMGALLFPVALLAPSTSILSYLAAEIVWVNVALGVFNMIPFGIFDGSKIWKWSAAAYLGLLAVLIALGVSVYYSGILF
jgi:Zn-dependent protease